MSDDIKAVETVLSCHDVYKTYDDGKLKVDVLHGVDLTVHKAEQVAIVGASGSGKSTLLHLLGGLDKPSQGVVTINGFDVTELTEKKLSQIRNQQLGFVYQFHHLLPEFTALENVAMPLVLGKDSVSVLKQKASQMLERVGLKDRQKHKVAELSGGERQRVAIARALVTNPCCLLADEPTGNLDPHTAEKVYEMLIEVNRELDTSIVIVTHDMQLARRMDRVLTIVEGQIEPC